MKIAMIAAMANDRVIGLNNQMPWHLPADLQYFKRVTLGKPVVMGRLTYESIGRPLPGRQNIVISRNDALKIDGVLVMHSLDEAIAWGNAQRIEELMVIGGGNLYQQALSLAHTLYLTHIDLHVEGDTHFPHYSSAEWLEVSSEAHQADTANPYDYRFVTYQRQGSAE